MTKPLWYRVIFAICAILSVYQCYFCVDKFARLPLSSENSKVDAQDYSFPAFVICPSLKKRYNKNSTTYFTLFIDVLPLWNTSDQNLRQRLLDGDMRALYEEQQFDLRYIYLLCK